MSGSISPVSNNFVAPALLADVKTHTETNDATTQQSAPEQSSPPTGADAAAAVERLKNYAAAYPGVTAQLPFPPLPPLPIPGMPNIPSLPNIPGIPNIPGSNTAPSAPPTSIPEVPTMPPGVSLDDNIAAAHDMSAQDFYQRVKTGGSWDYKQQGGEYEDFGNFNFGATAAAMGVPEDVALRGAGVVQEKDSNSKDEWGNPWDLPGSNSSYGDDPHDQEMIRQGYEYYRATHPDSNLVPAANRTAVDSVIDAAKSVTKAGVDKLPVSDPTKDMFKVATDIVASAGKGFVSTVTEGTNSLINDGKDAAKKATDTIINSPIMPWNWSLW